MGPTGHNRDGTAGQTQSRDGPQWSANWQRVASAHCREPEPGLGVRSRRRRRHQGRAGRLLATPTRPAPTSAGGVPFGGAPPNTLARTVRPGRDRSCRKVRHRLSAAQDAGDDVPLAPSRPSKACSHTQACLPRVDRHPARFHTRSAARQRTRSCQRRPEQQASPPQKAAAQQPSSQRGQRPASRPAGPREASPSWNSQG